MYGADFGPTFLVLVLGPTGLSEMRLGPGLHVLGLGVYRSRIGTTGRGLSLRPERRREWWVFRWGHVELTSTDREGRRVVPSRINPTSRLSCTPPTFSSSGNLPKSLDLWSGSVKGVFDTPEPVEGVGETR